MKTIYTALVIFVICSSTLIMAQPFEFDNGIISISNGNTLIDTANLDPLNFFPLNVSDYYQYLWSGNMHVDYWVVKDSIIEDGSRLVYDKFDADHIPKRPSYLIDTLGNVYSEPETKTHLLYKLDAENGDEWWVEKDEQDTLTGKFARVPDIFDGEYFGRETVFKVIEYYYLYEAFPGQYEEYYINYIVLAYNIGLVYSENDGLPPDILTGAVIQGDTLGTIVGVNNDNIPPIPNSIRLSQNYPNPFNAQTNIEFDLPLPDIINLTLYNLLGEKIATIADGFFQAGKHSIRVDFNLFTQNMPSGVYIYQLHVNNLRLSNKMMLLE